ncbi:MAG: 50S ribosomal protein L3 [Candidatus Hydrogenedens sp.]|nr:50S ribosomal protein L3 [Candidatus Hydrogenedens sp.]
MVNAILGRKLGMTRVFTEDGRWIEVTLVQAGPCTVVQRKTAENDGYDAVQVGFEEKKERRTNKPMTGHFEKNGVTPKKILKEFRVEGASELKPGDNITTEIFKAGDKVDVQGTTKGRGFAGVHKRHGMGGGPGTHGSHFHRVPGSVGQSADPSKVYKGKRLPGRMGNKTVTTQNLEVVLVDSEKHLLGVRGAIPGANGGLVMVKQSVKQTVKG